MTTTDPAPTRKPIARELLRFGLGSTPMPVARLRALLDVAGADDTDTIRVYNGSAIVERPAP